LTSRMITVNAYASDDEMTFSLDVSGHANSAPYGEDIVCAAVSILTTTTAQRVSDIYDAFPDAFIVPPVVLLESGKASIHARLSDAKVYHSLSRDISAIFVGYFLLEYNYSDRVRLRVKGDFPARLA